MSEYNPQDELKNERLIKKSLPRSARLIKENNEVINYTDAIATNGEGKLALRAVATL
jgi:hypothetical protein